MSVASLEPRFLRNAGDAATLFEPHFVGCTREKLLVAHLAQDRRLLRVVPEEGGGPSHIDLPVRAIVADAARLGSMGLVLAHCHPSGDPTPSEADIAVTRKLGELADSESYFAQFEARGPKPPPEQIRVCPGLE